MIKPILRERYGFDLFLLARLPTLLEEVGFTNIQRKVFHLPFGEWARNGHLRLLGGYCREIIIDFVAAMASRPLVEAGFDRADIADLVRDATQSASNRRIHAYYPIHFVWAQKPPV